MLSTLYTYTCILHYTCDIEVALVELSVPPSTQLRLIAPVYFSYVISLDVTYHVYREGGRSIYNNNGMRLRTVIYYVIYYISTV